MLTIPSFRLTLVLAAFAAAVCSQAVTLNYSGAGPLNGNATTTLNLVDDFKFASSITTSGALTLYDTSGLNGLRLSSSGLTTAALYAGVASVTGFGTYTGYTATSIGITITTNNTTGYSVTAQGAINPVPEPSAVAALGFGSVALLRRRRKA